MPLIVASSNKPTYPCTDADTALLSDVQPPKQILSTHPFIDKISLVIKPHSVETAKTAWSATKDVLKLDDFRPAPRHVRYQDCRRLRLGNDDSSRDPLFQAQYLNQELDHLRLEFNPHHLTGTNWSNLKATVQGMVGGWDYALNHSHITRLDVAIDVQGLTMRDFMSFSVYKRWFVEYGRGPDLQTIMFGNVRSNQIAIYDKGAEQTDAGRVWSGSPTVRFECRLRPVNSKQLTPASLASLDNPFTKIAVSTACPPPKNVSAGTWQMFLDSCHLRGPQAALSLLDPNRTSPKYKKHLQEHVPAWWSPEATWQYWPSFLATTELLKP